MSFRFALCRGPLPATALEDPGAGGFVTFEGKVRRESEGREVARLDYEAAEELVVAEGAKVLEEAGGRFGLLAAEAVHRLGTLDVGEAAIRVAVAAPHRREAFAAAEWIVDQVKHRVPVWKKEAFADGESAWVGVPGAPHGPAGLWERQARMPEVGEDGQSRLAAARVLLVGVGGLGCAALPYLAGAGVGSIAIVDPDEVSLSNLHRQILYKVDETGRLKADRAAAFARGLSPGLDVRAFPEALSEENVDRLVADADWVVDGTDSLRAKFLLNAACRRHGKPFVTASVHRMEGHVMTVVPDGPCLACLFPEEPPDGCVGTCAETGILGVVPGLFGVLQAAEVVRGILGMGPGLSDRLLLFDLRGFEARSLGRAARPGCLGCAGEWGPPRVEVASIEEARRRLGGFVLVDVREEGEGLPLAAPHERVPASCFEWRGWQLPVLLVCARGVRSLGLAHRLRSSGHGNVYSLRGGAEAVRVGA